MHHPSFYAVSILAVLYPASRDRHSCLQSEQGKHVSTSAMIGSAQGMLRVKALTTSILLYHEQSMAKTRYTMHCFSFSPY